jgi:hypothetical protein
MKKIILILSIIFTTYYSFSQINSCPIVNGYGFTTVSSAGSNCTSKVFVYITTTVSSIKGLRIQVYDGMGTSGTLLSDNCFSVPPNSTSSYFETGLFTAPCLGVITYVMTGYNSSNGNCDNGSVCGNTTTVMAISAGPLPIKMKEFYAKRKNGSVVLTWNTESELNAKEFVLQRKDEKDYLDVATIPASNIASGSFYTYTDKNNAKAVSQYRLKMVDQDGAYKYSEVRVVKGSVTQNDFTVFPNPSNGYARVTVSDITEAADVQLVDLSGRILKNISMNNRNTVDINDIQKGIYMIRVVNRNSGESLSKKIAVLK